MKLLIASLITFIGLSFSMLPPSQAYAAGTSTYSLQVNGNSISVYETSSVAVNTVEADFTYAGLDTISAVSVAIGGTFTTCTSQSSTSIVCTALGGNITGTHLVATLSFTPKNQASDAVVTVSIVDSSMILASSDSSDTLNHANLPSTTYRYTVPAAQPTPKSTPSSGTTTSHPSTSKGSTAANQYPSAQSANSKTQAIYRNREITVDTSAAKLPDFGWINFAATLALVIALVALSGATVRWLMSHKIRLIVTSAPKNPVRENTRPTKEVRKTPRRISVKRSGTQNPRHKKA